MSEIVGHLTISRAGSEAVYEIREGENIISDERGLKVVFTPTDLDHQRLKQTVMRNVSAALGLEERPPAQ